MKFQDHFSTQASGYAQARPTYPAALFTELARLAPGRALAWDAGAGNGQAALGLAAEFERVLATEPSEAQLAAAERHPRVTYERAAETAPMLADGSVDLVTVAQAAHWFDLPRFYAEVRRVLRPGGIVAIWTYGLCEITPEIVEVIERLYGDIVGSYWPPERIHPETGYRELFFDFDEFPFPRFAMELEWTGAAMAAYLRTWSAVARYRQAHGGEDPVALIEPELFARWGDGLRRVRWPLGGRIARVG